MSPRTDPTPWPYEPTVTGRTFHTPAPVRHSDDPPNPWTVRLLVYSILLVIALVLGVLTW